MQNPQALLSTCGFIREYGTIYRISDSVPAQLAFSGPEEHEHMYSKKLKYRYGQAGRQLGVYLHQIPEGGSHRCASKNEYCSWGVSALQ